MSYYIRSGNTFTVTDEESLKLYNKLPRGNYIIKSNQGQFFFEQTDTFVQEGKIYGNLIKNVDRIMNTFDYRTSSTGIMLTGEKGSGKTLTARLLAIACNRKDIPVIIVNSAFTGDQFNKFIQDIDQPCMILFDEFEKVYDRDDQEAILTLLDGVFPSKKLFVFTCNDKYRIDTHMRNRPGRIYYMIEFEGLTQQAIREYCNDNLKNLEHVDAICNFASLFTDFSIDMLKALVSEMNLYNESPQQALAMLNIKPEFSNTVEYNIEYKSKKYKVDNDTISPVEWTGNPLHHDGIDVEFCNRDGDRNWTTVSFNITDLKSIDKQSGKFTYVNEEGTMILTRVQKKHLDISTML